MCSIFSMLCIFISFLIHCRGSYFLLSLGAVSTSLIFRFWYLFIGLFVENSVTNIWLIVTSSSISTHYLSIAVSTPQHNNPTSSSPPQSPSPAQQPPNSTTSSTTEQHHHIQLYTWLYPQLLLDRMRVELSNYQFIFLINICHDL